MKKIVYIPLDERPCNYDFPYKIFNDQDFVIIRPPIQLLGFKKVPAKIDELALWLKEACKGSDGLVIALDTLIYGGIVPSRLHHNSIDDLHKRIFLLKEIKEENPNLIIYGFQLIMRCPGYNSSEEEPDYYADYGVNISKWGTLNHLHSLGKISKEEFESSPYKEIPQEFLDDFLHRREINREVNVLSLELVKEKIIDFFVIPQDDSAEFGWTAIDQEYIRNYIAKNNLYNLVYMYPGADEVGCTLMSRMYLFYQNIKPKIYIKYPSITSGSIIPSIEDRYLDTMVKYHIIVSGGLVATSLAECDGVAFINAPADRMLSSLTDTKEGRGMTVLRNMPEAMEFIEYAHLQNKAIIVGDITYGNGSNIEIYHLLSLKNMLFDIASFGGWNTASNSIGSAIAHGYKYIVSGKTKKHMSYLLTRYIEDIGYCGYVRKHISRNILPDYPQYSYYNVLETKGFFSELVQHELEKFISENMPELVGKYKITDLYMPWKRMYEIGLTVEFIGEIDED